MRIEADQIDTLRERRFRAFIVELRERARPRHGETVAEMPDEELDALLAREVAEARSIGLKTRSLMERFTDLSLCVGPGFAAEPWARSAFNAPGGTPAERLYKVERKAVFVLRSK